MSRGNDPSSVPSEEEPEPEECRYCDRRTYNPRRICPDCHHEGVDDQRECEAFNCADFARETVDGREYCGFHARRVRSQYWGCGR